MWDEKRPVLQRNGVDSFVLAVAAPLGPLTHLRLMTLKVLSPQEHCSINQGFFRVWHDNSGRSAGWYFSRMQVTDMQTKKQYFFINDQWLALEEGDGMVSDLRYACYTTV